MALAVADQLDQDLGSRLGELASHVHEAVAELAVGAATSRPPGAGARPASAPAPNWMAIQLGFDLATARDLIRVGRGLADLPLIRAAFSAIHVDVGVLTGERPDGRCHPARDRTCRYPGCRVPARRTRGHHLKPWWMGGRTNLGNGLSLCGWHHARLHDGHNRIVDADGVELRFERPDGTPIAPPRRPPSEGAGHLRRQHAAAELAIGARTLEASWLGERADLHYVADVYTGAAADARAKVHPPQRGPFGGEPCADRPEPGRIHACVRACSSPDRALACGARGSRFDSCQAHSHLSLSGFKCAWSACHQAAPPS
jgi:hypothetical protein